MQVVCTYKLYNWHVLTNYTPGVYLLIIQVVCAYKFHSSLQNEFPAEFDLVLSLYIFRFLSFPSGLSVAAYVFFHVILSLPFFSLNFIQQRALKGSSYVRCDLSI
jgi:hypothetical protein